MQTYAQCAATPPPYPPVLLSCSPAKLGNLVHVSNLVNWIQARPDAPKNALPESCFGPWISRSSGLYLALGAHLLGTLEVGWDDDHGHRGVVDDVLANRTKHHPSEPPASVAAHDYGVHLALFCEPQQLSGRVVPEEQLRVHVEP